LSLDTVSVSVITLNWFVSVASAGRFLKQGLTVNRKIEKTRLTFEDTADTAHPLPIIPHCHRSSISKSLSPPLTTIMPPKKADKPAVPRFGRPGNNLKMGIVGLPNVGKSSLFNLLGESAEAAAGTCYY
jgi:ribosome biogenesis GTPase A